MASQELSDTYGVAPASGESSSIFTVLRRRWLVILLVMLLAGGAAAAVVYLQSDKYESTAKLLFRQTIGPELNAIGLQPGAPDADNLAAANVELVGSRRVAIATSRELQSRGVDMSPSDVEGDVNVFAAKDTEVVDVTATADSAERAALIANVYAEQAQRLADLDQKRLAERALRNVEEQIQALPAGAGTATAPDTGGEPNTALKLRNDAARLRTLADVGTGSPQIIQPGYEPEDPTGNPIQTIVLGLLLGIVLGVGLALLREQADRRLHRADQVSAAFEAPVLTTVPRNRKLKRNKPFADLPPEVAEAFRMLQMNLRFGQDGPVQSVLVTSSRSREGKTTIAWNLASAAASAGLSVALIEADLRRPSLAQRYGVEPSPGLSEALLGEAAVGDTLQTVQMHPEGSQNGQSRPLHVVAAGRVPANPSALMQSSIMLRILDVLRRHHDLVVIDTPPLAHVADAISLLRHVDGVLVCASVSSTRGPEAGRLRDQLRAQGANVLGVVANGGSAMNGYAYAPPAQPRSAREGNGDSPSDPLDLIGQPPANRN
jgi:capsular exopolysaccharide synthesis family protein